MKDEKHILSYSSEGCSCAQSMRIMGGDGKGNRVNQEL